MKYYLKIHPTDTVAVALTPLKKGSVLPIDDNTTITLTEDIPQGHKFALTDLAEGSSILNMEIPSVLLPNRSAKARGSIPII